MIGLVVALLLASCAPSIQYANPFGEIEGSEAAIIYFINPSLTRGVQRGEVFVNTLPIGLMGEDSYLQAKIPIEEAREVVLKTEFGKTTELPFKLEPGETYYFRYEELIGNYNRSRAILHPLTDSGGEALLAQVSRQPKEELSR